MTKQTRMAEMEVPEEAGERRKEKGVDASGAGVKAVGTTTTIEFESVEEALEVVQRAKDAFRKQLADESDPTETVGGIALSNEYWDCECPHVDFHYIHPVSAKECDICKALQEDQPNSRLDEVIAAGLPITEAVGAETPEPEAPAELTPKEQIEAYRRKEQVLREALSDLNSLTDQQADARREMNSFKKPISDAQAKVSRLISCDVSGFLRWEREQVAPLLRKAEEEASAWREEPVERLDVTARDREKLAEHFVDCGGVADWLGKDFPDKKPGLSGEKTKDRLRDAINKISGNQV